MLELVAGLVGQERLELGEGVHAGGGEVAQLADGGVVAGLGIVVEQQVGGLERLVAEGGQGLGDGRTVAQVAGAGQCRDLGQPVGGVGEQGRAAGLVAEVDAGLGVLHDPLDRVEHLAGQRGLGGHRERAGGADDGEATDEGGEPSVTGRTPRRQRQALRVGRGEQQGVGGGEQLLAEGGAELGPRLGWCHLTHQVDEREHLGVPRVRRLGRGLDQALELLGATGRREHRAHRTRPVWSVVVRPAWPPIDCPNDARAGEVTAVAEVTGE